MLTDEQIDRLIDDLDSDRPNDPRWRLPSGHTLDEFRRLVPGLLTFGGASWDEIRLGWGTKYTYDGCPLNRAIGLTGDDSSPPPRLDVLVNQFLSLFDFGYLDPPPDIDPEESRSLLLEYLYRPAPEPEGAPGELREPSGGALVVDG